jgi:D-threo-aldose 1-dehydrogenase
MNLIREIKLPNGRSTRNLGFGCAGILRLPTGWQRESLLRTAFDVGITHFDVARMYGAGAAEGILGSCLKTVKDDVTFATKFGFPCGVPSRRTVFVQSVGRWAVNLHPGLKKRMKRHGAAEGDRHYDYSVKEMESSLHTSLAQLQTEQIDLFFIHEPRAEDAMPEPLGEALRIQREQGRIGAYGLSGMPADVLHFMQHRPELCGDAIQYNFSLDKSRAVVPMTPIYTGIFHVLAGTLSLLAKFLEHEKVFARLWSDKLSLELTKRENLATIILAIALNEDAERMVLFFTSNTARLSQMVKRLTDNSFSAETLSEFRDALADRAKEIYAL